MIKNGGFVIKNLKKLTLLHSNDIHGDFFAEDIKNSSSGGVSLLSGYLDKVRSEEKNTLYCIAGDMLCGSIIDSEFLGLSTIDIINMLTPDVMTVGNHEIDYGIAHMLFIEKCADFPIINANLHIKDGKRLFRPCYVKKIGGMKVLFIGIVTTDVLSKTNGGALIDTFVGISDAAREIGKICNTYNRRDIDLTVLLTHIGFEEDKQLAMAMDPAWGIDIIIGGHSHTTLQKPELVNGIPIVQAGCGTDYVGRFDLMIDTDNNCVDSFKWELVPITTETASPDRQLDELIENYKNQTDKIYSRCITRLRRELSHPSRYCETELGGLFSDILMDCLGVEIMMLASGSVRKKVLGPVVTYADLKECFPFDDEAYMIRLTGEQLRKAITHILRDEVWDGDHCEFYQFSRGVHIVYNRKTNKIEELMLNGENIDDKRVYRIGIQAYHYRNLEEFFSLSHNEIEKNGMSKILSTSCFDILEEYLSKHLSLDHFVCDRLVVLNHQS